MAPVDDSEMADEKLLRLAWGRFSDLTEAETKLLCAAPKGRFAYCGPSHNLDDQLNNPAEADKWGPERHVRAEIILWLCSDREAASRVHHRGVRLVGAKINGRLDLAFATVTFPLGLVQCRVMDQIILQHAHLRALSLDGSRTQVIVADGINVRGDISLRNGFTAEGEVRLLGAQIDGDLNCSGGTFKNLPQNGSQGSARALNAAGADVKGNVLLRDRFTADGEVWLVGAQIGGDLSCTGGAFSTLIAQGTRITHHLFLSELRGPKSWTLDLTNASADALIDDEASWPAKGNLHLDGFVYGRISGSPTGAETRIKWLGLQRPFTPQPYRQLARVLREMGDDRGARRVLYEMEMLRRREQSRIWRDRLHNEKLARMSHGKIEKGCLFLA